MRLDNRVSNKHAKIRSYLINFQVVSPSYAIKLIIEKASEARQEPLHEADTALIDVGCSQGSKLTEGGLTSRQTSACGPSKGLEKGGVGH